MILNGSTSTTDAMKAVPDENGFYDPIDGLLEEIAASHELDHGLSMIDGRDVDRRLTRRCGSAGPLDGPLDLLHVEGAKRCAAHVPP
jgi:hypothetical protein